MSLIGHDFPAASAPDLCPDATANGGRVSIGPAGSCRELLQGYKVERRVTPIGFQAVGVAPQKTTHHIGGIPNSVGDPACLHPAMRREPCGSRDGSGDITS